ncbi:hypothetical protein NBE98_03700 [Clostridium swellfunianum]|uniref:hypothetical protein n=1 Tax=Clostridium swellfunianum TaxID=1367462 RepID=UPI00202F4DC5|nr:hypothetical protein [Clostridium swellfunianum]MCM0647482.1 hypothetical protein [Clostridium swellfunianum]
MKRDKKILEIVKNKILNEYKKDILLLVVYGNDKADEDENLGIQFYFIPKNERGKNLSTQFIVEDVSYDLFPISWERLIANAAMDSPQGYLLLDTEVIYYSDEEALNRFENMKDSLKTVLSGKYDEALVNKAYEYFNESYIYLYNMYKYKDSMSSVRLEAGKLLNKIANALGFANREYYKNGNGSVLRDSLKLERLPKNYKVLVNDIIFSTSSEEIYLNSLSLAENTRELLLAMKKENKQNELFETLFTGYYEELKKSINKCKLAVSQKDYYKLYELFSYIQEEVGQFVAKVEEGIWYDDRNAFVEYGKYFKDIFGLDLLELTSQKDNEQILMAIDKFEKDLVSLMRNNQIKLLDFKSVEEFEIYFRDK